MAATWGKDGEVVMDMGRHAASATIEDNWLKLDQQVRDGPTIELMLRLTIGA